MTNSIPSGKIDIEALFAWLEQEPSLKELREKANRVTCQYRPEDSSSITRITAPHSVELDPPRNGVLGKFRDSIWVPGRSMRGKAYATSGLDASLNGVAKLMSLSTIFDFLCTLPLFTLLLVAFQGAALPGAFVFSYILLLFSNASGEAATNRARNSGNKANWSLLAFIVLCGLKTVSSGPGVDLLLGSQSIATVFAGELAKEKLEKDQRELARLEGSDPSQQAASRRCADLNRRMEGTDRRNNERQFQSLFVQAFGSNAEVKSDVGLTSPQLVEKYGSVAAIPGACRQEQVWKEINREKAAPLRAAVDEKSGLIGSQPNLVYLQQQEPDLFNEHFRSRSGEIEWVSGQIAVSQAFSQFYANLFAGRFSLIVLSIFILTTSVVLTALAAKRIYDISQLDDVKASYTNELTSIRDDRLDEYGRLIDKQLKLHS
ncbi:hypothetical protein KBY97_00515 [Synechococcus sp. ATX 2A4]|uniref:hypothetical protein n=1 Tax=Synechococcus sp. ATX 2A4 TaxID=2823727 RepID=UPI0020CEC890|nr:hypothetical protein [Synechococcus sp. ATX 2A4]MCP9883609.1 hypothetical protein [Synechococcus sp. ATX 2A4]